LRLQRRRRDRNLREPSAGTPLPRHAHRDPAVAGPVQPFRNRRRLDARRRRRPHLRLTTRRRPMPLGGLQHFTIEPQDLERTKDFCVDVLGLEIGDRPPLDFPGYWLYSGGAATVHLMGTRKPREGIVVRGTEKKYEDTGRLDHIAFAATDVD